MVMPVERRVWVEIDLERIMEHARLAGVRMNRGDAEMLLHLWGFVSCGDDQWVGDENALLFLRDDEIRRKRTWNAGQ